MFAALDGREKERVDRRRGACRSESLRVSLSPAESRRVAPSRAESRRVVPSQRRSERSEQTAGEARVAPSRSESLHIAPSQRRSERSEQTAGVARVPSARLGEGAFSRPLTRPPPASASRLRVSRSIPRPPHPARRPRCLHISTSRVSEFPARPAGPCSLRVARDCGRAARGAPVPPGRPPVREATDAV